ncbi:MAG: hypothetical protein Q7U82_08045 [Gammaproteobacteria bacterium]|nr:hypothetical protein [Gammaproteobacteria bacterium]
MTVNTTITRRQFNKLLLSAAVATAVFGIPGLTTLAQAPLRIGIIGSRQIGGDCGTPGA